MLKCEGCGNISDPREVFDYQKQQRRQSLSRMEQIVEALRENDDLLEDLRIRLVRIEHLLEQIEQK